MGFISFTDPVATFHVGVGPPKMLLLPKPLGPLALGAGGLDPQQIAGGYEAPIRFGRTLPRLVATL